MGSEKLTVSKVSRKVLALDMEASAFLKLCEHMDLQSLGVIKGVSDLGDEDKSKDDTIYDSALEATGEAILDWIKHMFKSMRWEPNEGEFDSAPSKMLSTNRTLDDEAGACLSRPYYNNFIRLLCDAVCAGYPVRPLDSTDEQVQPPIGVKVIMPPDGNVGFYQEQGQIESYAKHYGVMQILIGGVSWDSEVR